MCTKPKRVEKSASAVRTAAPAMENVPAAAAAAPESNGSLPQPGRLLSDLLDRIWFILSSKKEEVHYGIDFISSQTGNLLEN